MNKLENYIVNHLPIGTCNIRCIVSKHKDWLDLEKIEKRLSEVKSLAEMYRSSPSSVALGYASSLSLVALTYSGTFISFPIPSGYGDLTCGEFPKSYILYKLMTICDAYEWFARILKSDDDLVYYSTPKSRVPSKEQLEYRGMSPKDLSAFKESLKPVY